MSGHGTMDFIGVLPIEVAEKILGYLDGKSLWSCLAVNATWRFLANQQKFWVYHCAILGLDPDDIPVSSPRFDNCLCLAAEEWHKAKRRAWKWANNNCRKLITTCKTLDYYRNRIINFNEKKGSVDIFPISLHETPFLYYSIKLTPNLQQNLKLIRANMNAKYCTVTTLLYVIIYEGFHRLKFYMALGIENGEVIDISSSLENYHPVQNNNNIYAFDPVINAGDLLFVSLTINSWELGPVFLVNLLTKKITRLSVPHDCTAAPLILTKNHLSFETNNCTEVIIFDSNGQIALEKSKFVMVHHNDNYVALLSDNTICLYELNTKRMLRCHPVSKEKNVSFLNVNPLLDDFYYLDCEEKKLYAYAIKSNVKLWEMDITVVSPRISVRGGYLRIYEENRKLVHAIEVKTGLDVKSSCIESYKYFSRGYIAPDPKAHDQYEQHIFHVISEDTV